MVMLFVCQRLNKRGNAFQCDLVHPSEDSARQLLIEGVDFIDTDCSWAIELPLRQIGRSDRKAVEAKRRIRGHCDNDKVWRGEVIVVIRDNDHRTLLLRREIRK